MELGLLLGVLVVEVVVQKSLLFEVGELFVLHVLQGSYGLSQVILLPEGPVEFQLPLDSVCVEDVYLGNNLSLLEELDFLGRVDDEAIQEEVETEADYFAGKQLPLVDLIQFLVLHSKLDFLLGGNAVDYLLDLQFVDLLRNSH